MTSCAQLVFFFFLNSRVLGNWVYWGLNAGWCQTYPNYVAWLKGNTLRKKAKAIFPEKITVLLQCHLYVSLQICIIKLFFLSRFASWH